MIMAVMRVALDREEQVAGSSVRLSIETPLTVVLGGLLGAAPSAALSSAWLHSAVIAPP